MHNARVHTFALKSTYQSREISLRTIKSRVYVGAALAYSITRNTYLKMPDKLPLNYYAQNAVHLEPFVGAKVLLPTQNQCLRKWALYSEIGTVDYKLLYKIKVLIFAIYGIFVLEFGFNLNNLFKQFVLNWELN